MKIAICDDEKIFLSELKSKIYDYSNKYNWESIIDTYDTGFGLLNSNLKYDIIILDFQMDDLDGLETAKLLREGVNKLSCIIFLTSYPEIAISAYDVDTYRFVVKDTLYTGLYKALDDFRTMYREDYEIIIKSENESFTINTEDIVFIEVLDKHSYIHLSNMKVLQTRKTLRELYKEVPHTHFLKIHKSFIINFKYIYQTGNHFVKLRTYEKSIPISRNYSTKFKNTYYNYLQGNKV